VVSEMIHPAKGSAYSLGELVYGDPLHRAPFAVGWSCTVYLAPHNYHRVHAPVAGTLTATRYIPGKLWPVAPFFANRLPRLFVENERVVFDIRTEKGHAYVVMVGALNVGKIAPAHMTPPFYSNNPARLLQIPPVTEVASEYRVEVGEELGTFMLGSTVIVLLDHAEIESYLSPVVSVAHPVPIKLGAGLLTELPS
jgi:phosphatidylserine decarboxylase